eukprot:6943285-Pyramimonas_sp.AAC.1
MSLVSEVSSDTDPFSAYERSLKAENSLLSTASKTMFCYPRETYVEPDPIKYTSLRGVSPSWTPTRSHGWSKPSRHAGALI